MYVKVDKPKENKSQSVANEVSQRRNGGTSTFQFEDNRPEAIVQRKPQELVNNSPQVKQLRVIQEMENNRPQGKQAAQLQGMLNNSSQQQLPIQKKQLKVLASDNSKILTHRKTEDYKSKVIQRVIVTAPVRVNTRNALTLAGGDANDMGVTTDPVGFTEPAFVIHNTVKKGQNYSTLEITQNAAEGNNVSVYLASGFYSTGLMIQQGAITNYTVDPANRRVYIEVEMNIANLSRRAELEHCDDFREAYRITLLAAEQAMTQVAGLEFGPSLNHSESEQLIIDQANQGLPFSINDNLGDLYLGMCQMSNTGRDGLGLHTFTIDRVNESRSIRSWISYFISFVPGISRIIEPKDIRQIIVGTNFQVPGPASNEVVFF